ncbi:MAG: hypothetical protein KF764_27965 [Labilithrix sp.]|nr:hypothetical protein [Labilithrix sp.]
MNDPGWRKVNAKDRWSWIGRLAFRSDTRGPNEIFPAGFQNRSHPVYKHGEIHGQVPPEWGPEQTVRELGRLFTEGPQYRNKRYYYGHQAPKYDVNPDTSVALTLRPAVAPIFPISDATVSWVYAVFLRGGFLTYQEQQTDDPVLATAYEVAVRQVPARDVLAAVKCVRRGGRYPARIQYCLHPVIHYNRYAEHSISRVDIQRAYRPHQARLTQIDVGVHGITTTDVGYAFIV